MEKNVIYRFSGKTNDGESLLLCLIMINENINVDVLNNNMYL